MTDILTVTPGERRVVRLFDLDMAPEHIRFLKSEPGALAQALGVSDIDPDHAEILKVSDLEELGLATYLTEGAGIPEAEIAADRDRLAALKNHVLVVLSRAFGDRAETIRPREGIRPIAIYGQPATDWTATPIPTDSAAPGRTPPREARAAARRTGGLVFAAVMVLLAVMLWLIFR